MTKISHPYKAIFCNAPWFEVQIYWDGSFGICCQESHKLHSDDGKYNINNMSVKDWFNSDPAKAFRKKMFQSQLNSECDKCYKEEAVSNSSRRHRANQKSVIFTKTEFDASFDQSPHRERFIGSAANDFEHKATPIDLHINLGNFCNLACKMCFAQASSVIAVQELAWGILENKKYIGTDWTKKQEVWSRFLDEIKTFDIENIHFMGGETLATNKIKEVAQALLAVGKNNCGISFVTNGTRYDEELLVSLSKFRRVGIEISIETLTKHNDYIRQGSHIGLVIKNIKKFKSWSDRFDNIDLTLRPAISSLSVGNFHTLLAYCLKNKILLKSLIVDQPEFLHPGVLPESVKDLYRSRLIEFQKNTKLDEVDISMDFNESDPNQFKKLVKLSWLKAYESLAINVNQFDKMLYHCQKWDRVYNFNMYQMYPEFRV